MIDPQPLNPFNSVTSRLLLLLALATLASNADTSGEEQTISEIIELEYQMEKAMVRGDTQFLDKRTTADFSFTHGDGWTHGGAPLKFETKPEWLNAIKRAPYDFRQLDSVEVLQLHGDIAITRGHYRARINLENGDKITFSVWYLRTYVLRDNRWKLLTHLTVDGPAFEPSPEDP